MGRRRFDLHIREDMGRNWSDLATSHRMPTATRNWEKQEMHFFLEPSEGVGTCQHNDFNLEIPILNFWPPELWENKLVVLSQSVYDNLLQQSQETNIISIFPFFPQHT